MKKRRFLDLKKARFFGLVFIIIAFSVLSIFLSGNLSSYERLEDSGEGFSFDLTGFATNNQVNFPVSSQSTTTIGLNSPADGASSDNKTQTFVCNASDADGMKNMTLRIWNHSSGGLVEEYGFGAAPSSCPYPNISEGPQDLRIKNYGEGDIPASDCNAVDSEDSTWTGIMEDRQLPCSWYANGSNSIDGKQRDAVVVDNSATGWRITIQTISNETFIGLVVWKGYKTYGEDPTGTYAFDTGCAGSPSNLTIKSADSNWSSNASNTVTNTSIQINYTYTLPANGTYEWQCESYDDNNDSATAGNNTLTIGSTSTSSPSLSINCSNATYPSSALVNASESNTDDGDVTYNLYVDGSNEASGSDIEWSGLKAAGTYQAIYNTTGGENYTSGSVSCQFEIGKGSPAASLTNDRLWTFAYDSNPASIGISETNQGDSDITYSIIKDSVDVGSSDSEGTAGTYEYAIDSTEGENWTAGSSIDSNTLNITKASVSLGLNADPGWTVQEGNETTVNGTGCPDQLTCQLYRDDSSVSNPDTQTLSPGNYTYEFNTTGNENYTSDSVSSLLTVEASVNCTDSDGDGYGINNGSGCSNNGYDCDDNNASIYQNMTGYLDSDRDGWTVGNETSVCSGESLLGGYNENESSEDDCNDSDKDINPGASEVCDGIDNDCDGAIDEGCDGGGGSGDDGDDGDAGSTLGGIFETNNETECKNNVCVEGVFQNECLNSTMVRTRECGDYDGDNCTEWSNWSNIRCGEGELCKNASCVLNCTDSCQTFGYECGNWSICGETTNCGQCKEGFLCDSGSCISELECNETCGSRGWECGIVCGESCGPCPTGKSCNLGTCVRARSKDLDSNNCDPRWTDCGEWSECQASYTLEEVAGGKQKFEGIQIRECNDESGCLEGTRVEEKSCSLKVPVTTEKVEWCGKNYVNIKEKNTKELVSRYWEVRGERLIMQRLFF